MSATDAHEAVAWAMIVTNTVAGVWALVVAATRVSSSAALWWFTGVAQATVVAQVLIGSWMIGVDGREVDDLHALYGFGSLIAVGIIWSYRSQLAHRIHLLYGGGGLFLAGMGLRALVD